MRHLAALLWACPFWAMAQARHDNHWLSGYSQSNTSTNFGLSIVNFDSVPPAVGYHKLPKNVGFTETAVMSSKTGELLFYSDGCTVSNRNHEMMANGDSLNYGQFFISNCGKGIGYPASQSIMALTNPGDSSSYFLVHIRSIYEAPWKGEMLYSKIHFDQVNPDGVVAQKNAIVAPKDSFDENLTAVRHGNGRDWWIVEPLLLGNWHFSVLLGPNGFGQPQYQKIGHVRPKKSWNGQAAFSPDGRKYVHSDPYNGIEIFDFDRCTGVLSNPVHIPFQGDTIFSSGAAVSPNSRFLYIAKSRVLVQFDLTAPDIAASEKVLSFLSDSGPGQPFYFMLMPAPDGKIYGVAGNTKFLHVIHDPNEEGKACNVEPSGFQLQTFNQFSIPNMVHFRLFDLPGSPCDTLGINTPVTTTSPTKPGLDFRVSPNPVSEGLAIAFSRPVSGIIEIRSITGAVLSQHKIEKENFFNLDCSTIANGLYFVSLIEESLSPVSKKIVVSH